ncbi:MAG: ABC transporter ATP-binding protein [Roseitalea sp.]|jgi:peptide/nickel transport system ATP-binding protein|nr:ABC transporter ATP-binding protein [Roseitalea sp.]MBO6721222.1 ABC transporter ATP-binding protein [Roseitalea sp.]MBO6744280.1 ABC transporter ATP-binding protein [Roseitalea sp.]
MSRTKPAAPLLEAQGLSIAALAGARPIISNVDFVLDNGTAIGIVGESGSGKTTLANALLGNMRQGLQRTHGRVRINGTDIGTLPERALTVLRSQTIGYVPQNAGASLSPTRTIGAQIAEMLDFHGTHDRTAQRRDGLALLETVGLAPAQRFWRRYTHQLSGGQQQRCMIALALTGSPQVLILDEPTSGLDNTTTHNLVTHLRHLRQMRDLAMVCVSHDVRLVRALCDRALVMFHGQLVEDCTSDRLIDAPAHPYTRALVAAIPRRSTARPDMTDRPPTRAAAATSHDGRVTGADHETVLNIARLTVRHPGARSAGCNAMWGTPRAGFSLTDVDLRVQKGAIVGIAGRSGSGKSTLLKAISGMIVPESGTITLDASKPLNGHAGQRPPDAARRVQMIWQNPLRALNPRATVLAALAAPLNFYFGLNGAALRDEATALMSAVQLPEDMMDRYPWQLSGGEAQRVAIARACAAQPSVYLCDEITSALDMRVQAAILSLIGRLVRDAQATFIFVSHDLTVLRAIADHVAIFDEGRLVEQGPVETVLDRPKHTVTRALLAAADLSPSIISEPDTSPWQADARLS